MNDKVDRLDKEVAELKTENTYLRESLNNMSSKMDDQASTTNDILLQQQQMMLQVMQHMGIQSEPISSQLPKSKTSMSVSNPKGEKVATKEGSYKEGRPARRRSSGVQIEDARPMVLPTVHTRNEAG